VNTSHKIACVRTHAAAATAIKNDVIQTGYLRTTNIQSFADGVTVLVSMSDLGYTV